MTFGSSKGPPPPSATGAPPPPRGAGATPTSCPTGTLQQPILALASQIVSDNTAAQAALMAGNYTLYGVDESKVQSELAKLQTLLAQQAGATPKS